MSFISLDMCYMLQEIKQMLNKNFSIILKFKELPRKEWRKHVFNLLLSKKSSLSVLVYFYMLVYVSVYAYMHMRIHTYV